jgi:hypothetical protein
MPRGIAKHPSGQRMTLVEQQAAFKGDPGQRAPMLIRQMDAANAKMNKSKQDRVDECAAAAKEIAQLQAQEDFLLQRYNPLVETLTTRTKFRAHTRDVLHDAHDSLARNIDMARLEKRHAQNEQMAHFAMASRHELDATRGFTCEVGTTADRYGRTHELHHSERRGKKPGGAPAHRDPFHAPRKHSSGSVRSKNSTGSVKFDRSARNSRRGQQQR